MTGIAQVMYEMSVHAPFADEPQPRFRREAWQEGALIYFNPISQKIVMRNSPIICDYLADTEDLMATDWVKTKMGE